MNIDEATSREYYQALLARNSAYEGIFYVGVKTTGVFCRPTCPARKPKFEHCEFYQTAQQALLASFRPCKRCRPLSHPNQVSDLVCQLVEAVEASPAKRWTNADCEDLSIDASTARRQFKKRFGMTFIEYARSRRLGLAMKQIRNGESVISAQIDSGYESGSGFRDAFAKIMGAAPANIEKQYQLLKASWLDTPLGPMIAVADEKALYLLEFVDRRGLEREIQRLRSRTRSAIIPGVSDPIESIQRELDAYFSGNLRAFHTPVYFSGTPFQQKVWNTLRTIPYGETRSYVQLAQQIGRPSSWRAVANANGANQLAIIVPCHRIITSDGKPGGYGGGVVRKNWLLQHEQR